MSAEPHPDIPRPGRERRHAFVTGEDADTVTAIDLATRRAVATLPTGRVPHSMALTPDGNRLYVVDRHGGSLTVVDPRACVVLATVELSADPMAAAVSPDGRRLAVLGRDRPVAWVFNAATGAPRHEIPLGDPSDERGDRQTAGPSSAPPSPTPAAPPTDGADIGPASTHPIWTADSAGFYAEDNRRTSLAYVDAINGSVTSVPLPSVAHAVYLDAAEARVYALCVGDAARGVPPSIVVLEKATHRLLADVAIPLAPGESGALHHATFDATGHRLFAANLGRGRPFGGHSVHVLDTGTLRLVARLEARDGAGYPLLSPDGERVFVVNHSSPLISVFDAHRLAPVAEVALPGAAAMGHGCFFTADGAHFWAVSSSAGIAYAVDTRTLQVAARVSTGPNSQDIAHTWRDAYA